MWLPAGWGCGSVPVHLCQACRGAGHTHAPRAVALLQWPSTEACISRGAGHCHARRLCRGRAAAGLEGSQPEAARLLGVAAKRAARVPRLLQGAGAPRPACSPGTCLLSATVGPACCQRRSVMKPCCVTTCCQQLCTWKLVSRKWKDVVSCMLHCYAAADLASQCIKPALS